MASGFVQSSFNPVTEQPSGEGTTGGEDADAEATSPATGPSSDASGTSGPPPTGDLRGLLTFSYYAPDATDEDPVLGLAGAWRDASQPLEGVDDFFSVWGLATAAPPPPSDPDTLEHNGLLGGFEWGEAEAWYRAGNAMVLQRGEERAAACLLFLEGTDYPVYAATQAPSYPEECRPEVDDWQPDASYDLVLYGGELFATRVLPAQVHTPPAFEVTEPDITRFQLPVDGGADLTIAWTGAGNPGDRFVIRAWDMFGRMLTAHAADDGSYTIPAADLAMLDAGPVVVTLAREHLQDVAFGAGSIRVLTRYERRGYLDLF